MSEKTCYLDLLLDNGDIVRIESKTAIEDEIHELIDNCRKRGDWFSVGAYEGTTATINGIYIERVNMLRVVAML